MQYALCIVPQFCGQQRPRDNTLVKRGICLCSAASVDLVEKSHAAQKLLKVVIAGLSEDAHSEEVRKVLISPDSSAWLRAC